jgi:hypothetical protein
VYLRTENPGITTIEQCETNPTILVKSKRVYTLRRQVPSQNGNRNKNKPYEYKKQNPFPGHNPTPHCR